MVNIWKVGAWPGIWTDETGEKVKEKFALVYAIPKNFIAIGSGYLPDVKNWTVEQLKNKILQETDKNSRGAKKRANQVDFFANKMKIEDIVLLYMGYGGVYIGEIKSDYYYVEEDSDLNFIRGATREDYAPHRRDVSWKYGGKRYEKVFFDWNDVVHKIEESDLKRVEHPIIKEYLRIIPTLPYLNK